MQWSWAQVGPSSGTFQPYDRSTRGNEVIPTPYEFLMHNTNQNFSDTQPSHQIGRPCPLLGPRPRYNTRHHQSYNRNVTQHHDGIRPRTNHPRTNASRWNPSVNYEMIRTPASGQNFRVELEYNNRRHQPNSHDPSPRWENNENLPDTKDVKIKKLPFSDVVSTLLEDNIINQGIVSSQYHFSFKQKELEYILRNKDNHPYKVQLRICKLNSSSEQLDYYPDLLQIAVNNNLCILPGTDSIPRGPAGPVSITFMCNLISQNDVVVKNADNQKKENLKIYVQLVKKLTSQDLIDRLKAKNSIKPEDTASQIKEKLQEDQIGDEIASTTLPYSLLCPLSKTRMKLPCRASSCSHFQCFDAVTYLQLNEIKPKWSCPVCSKPAFYDHLQIDGYFKAVVEQNISSDKIILLSDGSWKPLQQSSDKRLLRLIDDNSESSLDDMVSTPNRTVVLDSDGDTSSYEYQDVAVQDERQDHNVEGGAANDLSSSVVIITLSDDESFINCPQTNNHTFRYCSTPQTSPLQTRRSSGFHASQIQNADKTQALQPFVSSTPKSLNASLTSKNRKRLSSKRYSKKRYSTNSSINNCGSDSIINNFSNNLNNTVTSYENGDSGCSRTENWDTISLESDTSVAVSHQKSPGRCASTIQSTMVLRSAVQKPETRKRKKRRGRAKK